MTAILGISAFYHDSAAALVIDGTIVAAAQEERFTRTKQDYGFPQQAIDYCLREAGIESADLEFPVLRDNHRGVAERCNLKQLPTTYALHARRSEAPRVGKEWRTRWSPDP